MNKKSNAPGHLGVTTSLYEGGVIRSELTLQYSDCVYQLIIRTQEAQIREALVKLGWTPPKESK